MVFPFALVKGIVTSGGMLKHRSYDANAAYYHQQYLLPTRAATGITAFFASCYTAPPELSAPPSRALLLQMVHEGADTLPKMTRAITDAFPIRPHEGALFEAGKTYVLGSPVAPRYQPVIGLDQPHQNIAVLGRARELVISDNLILCDALGATVIHEILPPPTYDEPPRLVLTD